MSVWVARDENGEIYAYNSRPVKRTIRVRIEGVYKETTEFYIPEDGDYRNYSNSFGLEDDDFPDVTFENSPVKLFTNMTVQRLMVRMSENLNISYSRGAKDMVMAIRSGVKQLCNIRQVLRLLDSMENEDTQAEMQLAMLKAIAKDFPYRTIDNIIQNLESKMDAKRK